MRRKVLAGLVLAACGACGRTAPAPSAPANHVIETAVAAVRLPSCARRTDAGLPLRLGVDAAAVRQGSGVALARGETKGAPLLAYVADGDSRSIHTMSIDQHAETERTRVAGSPAQVLVLPDGRVAVTLPDVSRIAVYEPGASADVPLALLCERSMPDEPWGLALSPDDATLVVTSAWAGRISLVRASDFTPGRSVDVARDPRSVLVDERGVAFVSHGVGATMSVLDLSRDDAGPEEVDLGAHKVTARSQPKDMEAERTASQGYALAKVSRADGPGASTLVRVLAPMASVDPGEISRPSAVYYGPPFDGVPEEAPFVSAVDPATHQPLGRTLVAATQARFSRECLLPRAAAVRAKTGRLYVACWGIDAVLELDAWALDPFHAERRRFDVPPGPQAIAIDEASGRAVVFSQMGAAITIVDLDQRASQASVHVDYHPDTQLADAAYGRLLFYRTDDTRISNDGVACASCHIDGRDDGVTWSTPTGPRQTPMLAGRVASTAPYGWEGERPTLADYIGNTVSNLGGHGLGNAERDALATYLLALKGPPVHDARSVAIERGRELFLDEAQECATCHTGDTSTDGARHDVLKGTADFVAGFDTPSLRFVGGTAPYFHDGRYATLEALLEDPQSHMGHSSSLGAEDRAALATYLRSL